MKLLVGSETVGTGATSAISKEEALAFQFTALESGTVEAVVFQTGTAASAATSVRVAIVADAVGKPGPILAGEEQAYASKPGENTTIEVPGFSTPVVEGTSYWLILLPLGGSLKIKLHKSGEAGGTSSRESSSPSKAKTIAEVTVWGGLGTEGPIFIAGRGEEGGATQVAGTAKVLLATTVKAQLTAALTAKAQFILADKAAIAVASTVVGSSQIRFVPVAAVSSSGAVKVTGSAALTFRGKAEAKTANTLKAKASLAFVPKAQVTPTLAPAAKASITLAAQTVTSLSALLGASSRIRMASTANVTGGGEIKVPGLPGRVSPTFRFGTTGPSMLAGRSSPTQKRGEDGS